VRMPSGQSLQFIVCSDTADGFAGNNSCEYSHSPNGHPSVFSVVPPQSKLNLPGFFFLFFT